MSERVLEAVRRFGASGAHVDAVAAQAGTSERGAARALGRLVREGLVERMPGRDGPRFRATGPGRPGP